MSGLRLNAIAIDEVRDMFGADEGLSAKLRKWTEATFSVPVHHHRRSGRRSPFHPLHKPNVEGPMLPVDGQLPMMSRTWFVADSSSLIAWDGAGDSSMSG